MEIINEQQQRILKQNRIILKKLKRIEAKLNEYVARPTLTPAPEQTQRDGLDIAEHDALQAHIDEMRKQYLRDSAAVEPEKKDAVTPLIEKKMEITDPPVEKKKDAVIGPLMRHPPEQQNKIIYALYLKARTNVIAANPGCPAESLEKNIKEEANKLLDDWQASHYPQERRQE